jgi:hypothetical protein
VNLNNIGIKNSTLGNGYNEVEEDSEIVFGDDAPDVYVYDVEGEVYYARGYKDNEGIIYSQNYILTGDEETGNEDEIPIIEPDNPEDWVFDSATGIITSYIGPDVETLIIPNSIEGVAVTSIEGPASWKGVLSGKNINNVIVTRGISQIGDYAFYSTSSMISLTIPNTVNRIGYYAVRYCNNLASITIPGSVKLIEMSAFERCNKMTQVILQEGIEEISVDAFSECTALTSISIPNSVRKMSNAFYLCDDLIQIDVDMAENVLPGAPWGATNATIIWGTDPVINFSNPDLWEFDSETGTITKYLGTPNLALLVIPAEIGGVNVKSIKGNTTNSISYDGILKDTNIQNLVISNGITKIDRSAFENCSSLKSVTLPNTVTSIGQYAFDTCSNLTNIIIPNSVTNINPQAFISCSELTDITLSSEITSISNQTFAYCYKLSNIIIPNKVTFISSDAFQSCTLLTSVEISSSVTYIDSSAFSSCTNLLDITVNKPENSIQYAPWGATNATVTWNP